MQKVAVIFILKVLFLNYTYSQEDFKRFVNSFPNTKSSAIIDFWEIAYKKNRMTRKEAVDFVYNGDSTKLYCMETVINLDIMLPAF